MIAFGPVPSRRLGRSLGINHIPPKICSYSCAYCQVGRTLECTVERRAFHPVEGIREAVEVRLRALAESADRPDHLAFVPDGEPTLDLRLGEAIRALRPMGIPIAVLTNGSLLGRPDVRADLCEADWVSVKVDAVVERAWRRIDAPHRSLRLPEVLDGVRALRAEFRGTFTTETLLVEGCNDGEGEVRALAEFLGGLGPDVAYLSLPTRPPARRGVRPPAEAVLLRAFDRVSRAVGRVEVLAGHAEGAFGGTGDVLGDLLATTAVHPMRRVQVEAHLSRFGAGWEIVRQALERGQLLEIAYGEEDWYLRPSRPIPPEPETPGASRREVAE